MFFALQAVVFPSEILCRASVWAYVLSMCFRRDLAAMAGSGDPHSTRSMTADEGVLPRQRDLGS